VERTTAGTDPINARLSLTQRGSRGVHAWGLLFSADGVSPLSSRPVGAQGVERCSHSRAPDAMHPHAGVLTSMQSFLSMPASAVTREGFSSGYGRLGWTNLDIHGLHAPLAADGARGGLEAAVARVAHPRGAVAVHREMQVVVRVQLGELVSHEVLEQLCEPLVVLVGHEADAHLMARRRGHTVASVSRTYPFGGVGLPLGDPAPPVGGWRELALSTRLRNSGHFGALARAVKFPT